MKKIFLAIALTVALGFGASAQRDGFFNDWEDFDNLRDEGIMPSLPNGHGLNGDQDAPLGTGLLILTALGAGYAVSKRKE